MTGLAVGVAAHAGWWSHAARRARQIAARCPLGALAAAAAAALCTDAPDRPAAAAVTFAAFVAAALLLRRPARTAAHLPVLRVLYPALVAVVAVAALVVVDVAVRLEGTRAQLLVLLVGIAASTLAERAQQETARPRIQRVAIVGDDAAARRLAGDLAREPGTRVRLVGRIAADDDRRASVPVVGALGDLRGALVHARIDLLVLGNGVARLDVFDELAESCLDLPLHLVELSAFYEDVFGHVPTAEINAAWFVHLVDPRAHRPNPIVKRAVDLVLAVALGLLTLPLVLVLATLVRLDGGPALFAQTRIGEGGRPFRLLKLRTMRVGSGDESSWAKENDPRMTSIGAFMRRSHVDELVQLWNVLRGEMSFVGPRPEQLPFVERLERSLPFYQRRHLIRPGLTGWAQVRCGYSGSDAGAAWKLCNDLYYVKHRSLGLDLLLLLETVGLLILGSTAVDEVELVPWAGTDLPRDAGPSGAPPAALPAAPSADRAAHPRLAVAGAGRAIADAVTAARPPLRLTTVRDLEQLVAMRAGWDELVRAMGARRDLVAPGRRARRRRRREAELAQVRVDVVDACQPLALGGRRWSRRRRMYVNRALRVRVEDRDRTP